MEKEKNIKRLPCGTSNFEKLITENYAYVDKTRFIELLENEANSNLFFLRPRKFGKTLFCSMLYNYYDVNKAEDFEKLFGNLYIGKHPTPRRNSYMVMQFDFSGINTDSIENFESDFNREIVASVVGFLSKYSNIIPDVDREIERVKRDNLVSGALDIVRYAAKLAKRKVFVIIDNYDHFANKFVATGRDTKNDFYLNIQRANKLVEIFYLNLKIGLNSEIHRLFITGISPSMRLNIDIMVNDLTEIWRYNEMMGFTQEETEGLVMEIGANYQHVRENIEMHYMGYLFTPDGEHTVYNPSMILYFFAYIRRNYFRDPGIIDENLQAEYNQLRVLLQNDSNHKKILKIAENNGAPSVFPTMYPDSLGDENYLIPMLFYMGLLTIDKFEQGTIYLKIPCHATRIILNHYLFAKRVEVFPEKVIFLDIDGVLQPGYSQKRFKHINEIEELCAQLYEKYHVNYDLYNKYDVLAVYYDWDKESVSELKRILDTTGAKIVISSDWRDKTIDRMVDLCKIHDLDGYIIDATTKEPVEDVRYLRYRAKEIQLYVDTHPSIKNYVAIDDIPLKSDLGDLHAIETEL
ncbi:MAG: AAA family ATPase, partial [Prevotellaceae bacterium]|nr:AAA family ATPase [Prevotellaceae bacterium]